MTTETPAALPSSASGATPPPLPAPGPAVHDFDFLFGTWHVHHRRLTTRLAGGDEWDEFDGSMTAWPILDGAGNIDDNVVEKPDGVYRAISLRTYDAGTDRWSIWWLDGRNPSRLDPPVVGGFESPGHGTFLGPDTFDGRPILVRYLWTVRSADSIRWEQAFSDDEGASWETNWIMESSRMS